jgi:predicted nuclease with RNAse H fold
MKIGIDPDLTKSGVALVVNGKIEFLKSLGFGELIVYVVGLDNQQGLVTVLLEDVDNKKPVFPKRHAPSQSGSAAKVNMSIAEDLGKVKATARLIKELLEDNGVTVKLVKPLRGPIKAAKKNSAYFNKITGWTGRSNEDTRDAALIALFG